MADFISDAITTIEANLLQLYGMKYRSMTQQERGMVQADIARLEASRRALLAEQYRANGTRPRIRDINLTEPAPGTVEAAEDEETGA